jgi:hypothetical protein
MAWFIFTDSTGKATGIGDLHSLAQASVSSTSPPLFLKNPLPPFAPMLPNLVPRLDRPWDTFQTLHDTFHIQDRMLKLAYRLSFMEFRGRG